VGSNNDACLRHLASSSQWHDQHSPKMIPVRLRELPQFAGLMFRRDATPATRWFRSRRT